MLGVFLAIIAHESIYQFNLDVDRYIKGKKTIANQINIITIGIFRMPPQTKFFYANFNKYMIVVYIINLAKIVI